MFFYETVSRAKNIIFRRQSFPGKSVTINVKTKPNSFVGLMAVDTRVNSLNLGHDLDLEGVVDEIRSYDAVRDPSFIPWFKVCILKVTFIKCSREHFWFCKNKH